MMGTEKTMMFTLGYEYISFFQTYWQYLTATKELRPRTITYLTERPTHPRPIGLETQLFNCRIPRPSVVVHVPHFFGCTTTSALCSDIRPRLEELGDAILVPAGSCPVQRRETVTINCVRIRTKLEKDSRQILVAMLCRPMQRRETHTVSHIDGYVGLAEYVQHSPIV